MIPISAHSDYLNDVPFLIGASDGPPEDDAPEAAGALPGFASSMPALSILEPAAGSSAATVALFNVYLHSRPDCVKMKTPRRISDDGRIYVCGGSPSELCGQAGLSTSGISDPLTQVIMTSITKPSCQDLHFSQDGRVVRHGDPKATVAIMRVDKSLLVFGREISTSGSNGVTKRGWWAAPTQFIFLEPHDQRSAMKFRFCTHRVTATFGDGAATQTLSVAFDAIGSERRDLKPVYAALFQDAKKILDHGRGSLAHPGEPSHWSRPSEPIWPYVMPSAALNDAAMAKMPGALRDIAASYILDNPEIDNAKITWTSATRSETEMMRVLGFASKRVFNNKPISKKALDETLPNRGFAQTFSSNSWGWTRPKGAIEMTEDVDRAEISAHVILRHAAKRAQKQAASHPVSARTPATQPHEAYSAQHLVAP